MLTAARPGGQEPIPETFRQKVGNIANAVIEHIITPYPAAQKFKRKNKYTMWNELKKDWNAFSNYMKLHWLKSGNTVMYVFYAALIVVLSELLPEATELTSVPGMICFALAVAGLPFFVMHFTPSSKPDSDSFKAQCADAKFERQSRHNARKTRSKNSSNNLDSADDPVQRSPLDYPASPQINARKSRTLDLNTPTFNSPNLAAASAVPRQGSSSNLYSSTRRRSARESSPLPFQRAATAPTDKLQSSTPNLTASKVPEAKETFSRLDSGNVTDRAPSRRASTASFHNGMTTPGGSRMDRRRSSCRFNGLHEALSRSQGLLGDDELSSVETAARMVSMCAATGASRNVMSSTITQFNQLCSKADVIIDEQPPTSKNIAKRAYLGQALASAIESCSGARNWQQALELLQRVESEGIFSKQNATDAHKDPANPPSIQSVEGAVQTSAQSCHAAAISVCAGARQWASALSLLTTPPNFLPPPSLVSYSSVVAACGQARQWREALSVLRLMKKEKVGFGPNAVIYSAVIAACGNARQVDLAVSLLREMTPSNGIPPDVVSYNSAIAACATSKQWQQAVSLLREMHESQLSPDVVSYSSAIDACSGCRQWSVALSLLREMSESGVSPNVVTYSSCITGLGACKQWKLALGLLDEMRSSNVPPNLITYNSCISACGQAKQWRQALQLIDTMNEQGVRPDTISWNAVITALGSSKQWFAALQTLREMPDRGVQRNVISYNSTISALGSRQWQKALALLREMGDPSSAVRPDVISYNACIAACGNAKQWEQVLSLFEEMPTVGLQPNFITCNATLSALDLSGRWTESLDVVRRMPGLGIPPTQALFDGLASLCTAPRAGQPVNGPQELAELRRQLEPHMVADNAHHKSGHRSFPTPMNRGTSRSYSGNLGHNGGQAARDQFASRSRGGYGQSRGSSYNDVSMSSTTLATNASSQTLGGGALGQGGQWGSGRPLGPTGHQ